MLHAKPRSRKEISEVREAHEPRRGTNNIFLTPRWSNKVFVTNKSCKGSCRTFCCGPEAPQQATLVYLLACGSKEEVAPDDDVREICNYLETLSYVRAELVRQDGLSLSMRLLNETHRHLMQGVRGASKQPGGIRRSQNWLGGSRPGNARFVPSPAQALPGLPGELEKYLHAQDELPPLPTRPLIRHPTCSPW